MPHACLTKIHFRLHPPLLDWFKHVLFLFFQLLNFQPSEKLTMSCLREHAQNKLQCNLTSHCTSTRFISHFWPNLGWFSKFSTWIGCPNWEYIDYRYYEPNISYFNIYFIAWRVSKIGNSMRPLQNPFFFHKLRFGTRGQSQESQPGPCNADTWGGWRKTGFWLHCHVT